MLKISAGKTAASLALSALLSCSLAGSLFAASAPFGDLGTTTGKDKIEALQSQGLVQGVDGRTFAPKSILTAAQGVQLISGGFQLSLAAIDFVQAPTAAQLFTKVQDGKWYTDAFLNAHYNGVEIPRDIDPAQKLTKEQFTFMLIQGMERAGSLPLINIKPDGIADESALTAEYQGAVLRSLKYGVAALDAKGRFNPKNEISRAEAAVMLYNALDYLKSHQPPATGNAESGQ